MRRMRFSFARSLRAKPMLITAAVAALAAVGAAAYGQLGSEPAAASPETVLVERGTVSLTASAVGTVAPARQWSLGFETETEITALHVAAGDQVAEGDVLAVADDTEAAELFDEAEAALEEAEDDLAEAEADTGDCAASQSGPGGGAALTQSACQGTDTVLSAQQRVNQAEVDLAAARDAVDATVITAPAGATVLSVAASEGTIVPVGTAVIELGDLSSVTVEAAFAEADAASLAAGQAVTVVFGDAEDEIEAEIDSVALVGTVDGDLVTYAVSVEVADPPASVRAGSTATVDIVLASVDEVLYVPISALDSTEGDQASLTVRAEDDTEQTKSIDTGLFGDATVEVRSGLAEGDTVVIGR